MDCVNANSKKQKPAENVNIAQQSSSTTCFNTANNITDLSSAKKNYCYMCGKPQSKIARHFQNHKDEAEIAQVLSLPKHSKEHKIQLEKLRNKGNYQHNSEVFRSGVEHLKVKRRFNMTSQSLFIAFIAKECFYAENSGVIFVDAPQILKQ